MPGSPTAVDPPLPPPPDDEIGVVQIEHLRDRWSARLCTAAVALALVAAVNWGLTTERFWRWVQSTDAVHFAKYHPVALELPNNMAPPPWAHGGLVALGSSSVGVSLPMERTEQRLGHHAWSVWASGNRPIELLALAPYVLHGEPRQVLIALEARYAGRGGDTVFTAKNRATYTSPCNPAWPYHRRQSRVGWEGFWTSLPAVRFHAPLRALFSGYLGGAVIVERLPDAEAWRRSSRQYSSEPAQAALARYRGDPTIARYEEYLRVVGVSHEGVREFWTEMRNVEPDRDGTSDNVQALLELTRYFRDRGIRVAWFLYPENPMCAHLTNKAGRIMAPPEVRTNAQRLFRELADREQVPYVDCMYLGQADEFLDYTHLAPPGSDRLGQAIQPLIDLSE